MESKGWEGVAHPAILCDDAHKNSIDRLRVSTRNIVSFSTVLDIAMTKSLPIPLVAIPT